MMIQKTLKRSVLFVAILALGALLTAPTSAMAQKQLRWKFKPGQKFELAIKQNMDMSMKQGPLGGAMNTVMNLQATVIWEVRKVDAKGTADILASIKRIAMSANLPMVGKIEYDSASKKAPAGMAVPFAKSIQPMIGAKYTQTINANGEMVKVEITKETLAAWDKLPNGKDLKKGFTKEGMSQLTGWLGMQVPSKAIQVGSTWNRTTEMKLPTGQFKGDLTYTYKGVEQRGGVALDKIDVKLKVDLQQKKVAGPTVTLEAQEGSGVLYFDNVAGQLVESTVKQKLTLRTKINGKDMGIQQINSTMTMQVQPIK